MTNLARRLAVAAPLVLLTACGRGDAPAAASSGGAPAAAPNDAPGPSPTPAAAAPASPAGVAHEVRMLGDAQGYRFEPADLTINTGDAVRWTNVSGGPHNVSFWADSVPAGTPERLAAQMPNTTAPLAGPLLLDPNATYAVAFVGLRPGVYRYYCTPHLALGMRGTITVRP